MKLPFPLIALLALILFQTGTGFAQEKQQQLTMEEAKQILGSLQWRTGTVSVGGDKVSIGLLPEYRYLGESDTRKVLSQLWGNPPAATWGMVFPPHASPVKYPWAMIVEGFEEEGYVKDEDADKIDSDKLLSQMQEGQNEANGERVKQGYAALEIRGWAMKPRYDKAAKKLTWAIDLKVAGSEEHSINYYVRILGRRGYLVLNMIGGVDDLPVIESSLPEILSMVNFNEGHRYADFNPKTDKVAAYGIAGLIAAGVGLKLAKLGLFALFFKKIGIILVAGGKWIVAAFVAIGAWIKKFFSRKTEASGSQQ